MAGEEEQEGEGDFGWCTLYEQLQLFHLEFVSTEVGNLRNYGLPRGSHHHSAIGSSRSEMSWGNSASAS